MTGDSRRDANQHLLNIRASKGLDTNSHIPQAIVRDLEAATKVLSDQLYQKSTHFLLELIQNADDNHYEVGDPTLHLTYAKNHLRVDCNEIGFSPKDIDALCSVGQSSKAGAGVSTQYVGEKGIGFKSVFKASNVVWVTSREYEFKFDKNVKMGMIAPILDDFPATKRAKWTSFYLQLASDYNVQELIDDLDALDARLLIFLRRLRTIVVTIIEADKPMRTKKLTRTEGLIEGKEAIHLSQDDIPMSYIAMRHRARNLPSEQRRDGVSESELLLAFPVDENNEPKLDPQQVYAFLPIRDYGFKFLMHADFLLIANRGDVDNSIKWNQVLRDTFVDAFLESVRWFNSGSLRYTWPRFLPAKVTSSFFSPLESRILDRLAREPTLEAWSKNLLPASKLIYVPGKYMDNDGTPLTLTASKHNVYISQSYSHDDYEHLKPLNVVEMGDALFLDHLEEITKYQTDYFFTRSSEWHSRLAAVLAKIWEAPQTENRRRRISKYRSHDDDYGFSFGGGHSYAFRPRVGESSSSDEPNRIYERIKKLPLIQLRDGQWICGEGNTVFFPGDSDSREIPGGISLLVVDPVVARDLPRAHLFRILGVKDFKIDSITQLIISNHSDKSFDPNTVSRADLISHMHFLYTTGWRNIFGKPFWFATEFDGRAPGNTLYVDDTEAPHSASKYFANNRSKFQFLHPDYQDAHPQDPTGWLTWLKSNMSLSNIPRLIRQIREVTPKSWVFEISPEFEFVINAWSALDALTLLCDHWLIYQFWIEPLAIEGVDAAVEASYRNLKKKISAMTVTCTDGKTCRLDETFLPIGDIPTETKDCVSFLGVPEPENPRWHPLAHFGVGVKQDVNFYLRCLEKLISSACGLKQVTFFYEQIQARSNEDQEKVRKFFKDKRQPIYVPFSRNFEIMPDEGAWFPPNQCLWNGPKCLKIHFSMNGIYPSCKRLFTEVLGVSDASMKELLLEIRLFKKTDELRYMCDVFLELEKFLEKDETYTVQIHTLNGKAIWPVKESLGEEEFDHILSTGADWFIADTEPLRESFEGIVPLLAFATDDIARMERVMDGLAMHTKRLSRVAKSVPRTEGRVAYHPDHTNALKSKYEFIARLVPPSAIDRQRRKRVLRAIQNFEVFTAEHIIQRYFVKIGNKEVEGRQTPGNVVLSPEEDSIKIYLREQYLELERNPSELVDKLGFFTGIGERKDGHYLLLIVLTESNPNRILDILAQHGIPTSYPDDDGEGDEWLSDNRIPRMHIPGMFPGGLPQQYGTESFTIISSRNARIGDSEESDSDMDGPDDSSFLDDSMGNPFGPGFRIVAVNNGNNQSSGMGGDSVDEELEFVGEKHVSQTLAKLLGDKFVQEEHWTSPRRTKAGLPPPTNSDGLSAFTIKDTQGAWTEIVARSGFPEARAWKSRPPTWHIEVKTTKRSLGDEFTLSAAQFDKARKFSVRAQEEKIRIPTDVVLLTRVFNTEQEPQLGMFLDPWELYLAGTLHLKSSGTYSGRVAA